MAINLFELPHIVEAIAAPLRFNDLVNCVRVNHTWYTIITPILWEDVITFRSQTADQYNVWKYQQYFLRHDQSSQGLRKNARHIRALTCQTLQLLTTLNTTHLLNLVEINFIVDRSCDAFPAFIRLISRSPKLRAVSMENSRVYYEGRDWDHLQDLVDVLCKNCPEISCIYLEGIYPHVRGMEELCARLLQRIRQDTTKIRKLTLQRPDLLTRSRRGPSRGHAWTTRESPLVVPVPETDMWRIIEDATVGNNGRWENEQWTPLLKSNWSTIAVMESPEELSIVLPSTFPPDAYINFLGRFPNCQDLSIGATREPLNSALAAFLRRLPKLKKIDLSVYNYWIPDQFPGSDSYELTSVSLHSLEYKATYALSRTPLWTRLSSLIDLDLDCLHVTISDLLHVLASTPHLRKIRIPSVEIIGTEQVLVPGTIWASRNLRQVSLGLYLNDPEDELWRGHRNDNSYWNGATSPNWNDDSIQGWDEGESEIFQDHPTEIAAALAPSFMAQLDAQAELRELELSFNCRLYPKLSPFLQLSLDPAMGLPRLANLKKLEKLVITGLVHQLGQQEIEWMSQHWPKLSWIEVPILHTDSSQTDTRTVSCTRETFSGQAPEYHLWFPQLHVAIPVDCYSCAHGCSISRCLYEDQDEELWEDQSLNEWDYDRHNAFALRKAIELAHEAAIVDPLDDLYLGRHYQHRSGSRPKVARGSRC